ncbi:MAG: DUF4159 domain-containing protein [Gammaproteobacteria bacterium]|nr:DUF4159 domain-containing protein [Gammaproteobacteria bacterium]
MPESLWKACLALIVAGTMATGALHAQSNEAPVPEERVVREAPGEFQFVRLAYSANRYGRGGGYGRGRRQPWQTDWPDAEHHFTEGASRLTRIDVSEQDRILTPLDNDIFDYPWIYAVEVGQWHLNEQEAAHLRDYLLRGGFLMVDDFHGSYEWGAFMSSMERVFPDRPIIDIPESDEAFHVHYDLDHRIQIPSRMFIYSGVTYERDGYTPHWRGIYDDDGRLMVAINFNMDIGDAWEHADWPDYPENMTALAYRFGINYLIYAMTH